MEIALTVVSYFFSSDQRFPQAFIVLEFAPLTLMKGLFSTPLAAVASSPSVHYWQLSLRKGYIIGELATLVSSPSGTMLALPQHTTAHTFLKKGYTIDLTSDVGPS